MSGPLRERLDELAAAGELSDLNDLAEEAVTRIERAVELLALAREAGERGYQSSHVLRNAALRVLTCEMPATASVPAQAETAKLLGLLRGRSS